MQNSKRTSALRHTSHLSAALLCGLLVVLILYWIFGPWFFLFAGHAFLQVNAVLIFAIVVVLAVFCLSTQHYLALKKQSDNLEGEDGTDS